MKERKPLKILKLSNLKNKLYKEHKHQVSGPLLYWLGTEVSNKLGYQLNFMLERVLKGSLK